MKIQQEVRRFVVVAVVVVCQSQSLVCVLLMVIQGNF